MTSATLLVIDADAFLAFRISARRSFWSAGSAGHGSFIGPSNLIAAFTTGLLRCDPGK